MVLISTKEHILKIFFQKYVSIYLSFNTIVSGSIQDRVKLFASGKGRILHGAKIINTVYSIIYPGTKVGYDHDLPPLE